MTGASASVSGSNCDAVGNQTLIAYNDIDDGKADHAQRRAEVDRNQGAYEASLMKLASKLTASTWVTRLFGVSRTWNSLRMLWQAVVTPM